MSRPPSLSAAQPARKDRKNQEDEAPKAPPFERWASQSVTTTFNKASAFADNLFFADPDSAYFPPQEGLEKAEKAYNNAYAEMLDEYELIKQDREAFVNAQDGMSDELTDQSDLAHAFNVYRRAIELLNPENFEAERQRIQEAHEARNAACDALERTTKGTAPYKDALKEAKDASKELVAVQKAYSRRLRDASNRLKHESFERAVSSFLNSQIPLWKGKKLPITVKQIPAAAAQMMTTPTALLPMTLSIVLGQIGATAGLSTPATLIVSAFIMIPQIIDWTKKGVKKLHHIVRKNRAKFWAPASKNIRALSGDDVLSAAKRQKNDDGAKPKDQMGTIHAGTPDDVDPAIGDDLHEIRVAQRVRRHAGGSDDIDPAKLKGTIAGPEGNEVDEIPVARRVASVGQRARERALEDVFEEVAGPDHSVRPTGGMMGGS